MATFLVSVANAQPKSGSNCRLEAGGKEEANQCFMSSVLNPRSHELWRETAVERAKSSSAANTSHELEAKAAENVCIEHNGGGLVCEAPS
jgi:hypothetical protein